MTNKLLVVAIIAASAMGATYGGTGLQRAFDGNDLDRVAPDASRIPGDETWGGYIKTEEEMTPPLSIRFDDMGSRPDHALMAYEFLKRGIPVSIGVNAWNVGAGDSAQIDSILTFEREFGTEVEWFQHTNGNMRPDRKWPRRGITWARGDSSQYVQDNGIPSTDWRYYTSWTWGDWVAELDPTPVIRLTGERPKMVVWPGNVNPNRAAFVRRNFAMFEDLFDTLGYDFGISGFADDDSSYSSASLVAPDAAPLAGSALHPFMYADWPFSKVRIPMPATLDLDTEFYVERFAPTDPGAPSWVPPGTQRFTFAENVTPYANSTQVDWTDYATANANRSFRDEYSRAVSAGGGASLVFHSEAFTNANATFTPEYPDGVSASYSGDALDIAYIAAACSALVAEGFFQPMTVSDHVRWLSKKPGRRGLKVGGANDFVFPWLAIGDSAGVEPNYFAGMGFSGIFNARTNQATVFSDDYEDTDYDGKLENWHYGIDGSGVGTKRLAIVDGYGRGGRDGMLMQFGSTNEAWAWMFYHSAGLVPGNYELTMTIQNTNQIDARSNITLQRAQWVSRQTTGDGARPTAIALLTDATADTTRLANNTDAWPAPSYVSDLRNNVNGFRDAWLDDGYVSDFSSEPWWEWRLSFSVPQSRDRLAPGEGTLSLMERWYLGARLSLQSGGTNQSPRISDVTLRWMGPVTE